MTGKKVNEVDRGNTSRHQKPFSLFEKDADPIPQVQDHFKHIDIEKV